MTITPSLEMRWSLDGAQGILDLGRQAGGAHIKAQVDGAGHLVDVLPARALGANHGERQVAFVDIQESWTLNT